MRLIVGVSDMKVSNRPDDVLTTYSLGSCLGLTLYDPAARIGGLVHCMLPLSKANPAKARVNPYTYTDTGVIALLQSVLSLSADRRRLIAKAAGCATLFDEKGFFNIGKRNYTMLRKILGKHDILIAGEDIGGARPRTMTLHMDTGITAIASEGRKAEI